MCYFVCVRACVRTWILLVIKYVHAVLNVWLYARSFACVYVHPCVRMHRWYNIFYNNNTLNSNNNTMLDVASCSFYRNCLVFFIYTIYYGVGLCIDIINSSLLYVLYYNYILYTFLVAPLLACENKKSLSWPSWIKTQKICTYLCKKILSQIASV